MKTSQEREKLEKLLDSSSEKITENVPTPGNIPKSGTEELDDQPKLNIDIDELRIECDKEARSMVSNAIKFIIPKRMFRGNAYIRNKLELDIMSLSGMIYQLRANESMQRAMMEEVNRGFMHPRMFEVFSGMSRTISDINKQLLATVEAIKITYKDVKADILEKDNEALNAAGNEFTALPGSHGGTISMGTKELISNMKKRPPKTVIDSDNIQDVDEIL